MYFPYLRGRQYELLALKELAKGGLLGSHIVPVVEPIKVSSTFDGTLRTFFDLNLPLALIFNPAVGDYAGQDDFVDVYIQKIGRLSELMPTLLMSSSASPVLCKLIARGVKRSGITTVLDNRDFLEIYRTEFDDTSPQYTLFSDERSLRRVVKQGKVMFEDKFNKQKKNADYSKNVDEFFSDDHLFYSNEGYMGFGDYSIIGNDYIESGFAPYAVAIHIVYFNANNELRVQHFISDSNRDISDVPVKFNEALAKYIEWEQEWQRERPDLFIDGNPPTTAMMMLNNHWENETYPGLPTLKKLSIMHHLELMGKFLDAEASK
ncbi:MAG: sce7725 family protein [Deltaproteobacteria bacterium]|jgi:hypothetical protein|nr:sce7725 family protein [Deltaproteobacteria bacterium]